MNSINVDLLGILGRSYLIEHCIVYFKKKKEERDFRINIAEIVRGLLGVITGNWDEIPRYIDTLKPQKEQDEPTAEEVICKIKKKLGG